MGSSVSSVFANTFLFYYKTNFIKYNINFFRYMNDIIFFNYDILRMFSIYPNELVLKK